MGKNIYKNYWNLMGLRYCMNHRLPIYFWKLWILFLGVIFMDIFYPLYRRMDTYKKHVLRILMNYKISQDERNR